MTFQEYINNPMGSKNSVMSNRKIYENLYNDKWGAIMVRENGHIDYTMYRNGNDYICHLKIPSEVVPKFYYDVVVKMTPEGVNKNLAQAHVQFFSNDPSFNFTFAHAFVKHNMHIKDLEPKMSKRAITKTAVEKNPNNDIGYVKSLFFAYIVMNSKGLFAKAKYDIEAKPYIKKAFLALIKDTDTCVQERQDAGAELSAEKKKARQAKAATTAPVHHSDSLIHPEVSNKFVTTTKRTSRGKSSGFVTKTKTVKRKR